MPTVIALLRAVNLTRHNRMAMEDLRGVCGTIGLREVQTYIQSGNIVFTVTQKDVRDLPSRMAAAISERWGFRPEVILRTAAEMRSVVARNPFAGRPEVEPRKLLVGFLGSKPSNEARHKLLSVEAPEQVRIDGRELYVYYPNGMARPRLSWAAIERILKTPATGRNWNTVVKLLAMAESCAGS